MTRMQQFDFEVKQLIAKAVKENMPEPKMLVLDLCSDLQNDLLAQSWSESKIPSGLQKKWISDNGFITCKKSEATALVMIGEKNDCGLWITGKYKNYWLKPA